VPDEPERDDSLVSPVSSSSSPIPSDGEPPPKPLPLWLPGLPRDEPLDPLEPVDPLDDDPDDPRCDPEPVPCFPLSRSISSPLDPVFRFWSAMALPSSIF
jgi:hypothetical protein